MIGWTRNSRNDERKMVAAYGRLASSGKADYLVWILGSSPSPRGRVTLMPHSSMTASFSWRGAPCRRR